MFNRFVSLAAVAAFMFATTAHAADPAVTCESGKLKESAKYASCRLKTESKAVLLGQLPNFSKCEAKFTPKFNGQEANAGPGVCPSEMDEASINARITGDANDIAILLAGGLLSDCPTDLVACDSELTTCDGSLATCTGNYSTCSTSLATCTSNSGSCGTNLTTCTSNLSTAQNSLTTCNGSLSTCSSGLTTCNGSLSTCSGSLTTCSGSLATCNAGTAAVGNVLAGRTFSSSAGIGVTGTMANVGQQNVTPGTAAVTITQGYHNGTGSVAGDADLVAGNIVSGVNIFGVAGAAALAGAQPLKTGQTTSYGMGDDGDIEPGATLQYADNVDGTITDVSTGLMWEKKVQYSGGYTPCNDETGTCANPHHANNVYSWGAAFAPPYDGKVVTIFLEQLNNRCDADTTISCTVDANCSVPGGPCGFAGHQDWRLPSVKELQGIINYGVFSPSVSAAFKGTSCGAGCTDITDPDCSCTASSDYWSSTTYAFSPTRAWYVSFDDGNVTISTKNDPLYVRAVRGGS